MQIKSNVGPWGEGKTGVPREKPLGAEKRTNPHMTPSLRIEPWPHRGEASALTTVPSLHSTKTLSTCKRLDNQRGETRGQKASAMERRVSRFTYSGVEVWNWKSVGAKLMFIGITFLISVFFFFKMGRQDDGKRKWNECIFEVRIIDEWDMWSSYEAGQF